MQLSLAQLSFSGTLLLLAMSNLLFWEHVSSSSSPRLSTGSLYQRVVELSHYTHNLASKVFTDFSEDLLKVSISVLQAWEEPLKHMVAAVAALPGASDVMLSRTKELEERILGLLEGLKTILRRIQPGAVENEYTLWSGWSDLQSSNEDTRNIVLYTLGRCVRRDTHKVDNFLKVLKCRDVHNNYC